MMRRRTTGCDRFLAASLWLCGACGSADDATNADRAAPGPQGSNGAANAGGFVTSTGTLTAGTTAGTTGGTAGATSGFPSAGGSTLSAGDLASSPPAAAQSEADSSVADAGASVDPQDSPPAASPFVRTQSDPFSTFAADVDTASYDIFRRSLLTQDSLPHPEEVRLEEFVNYFRYGYETPALDAKEPFGISLAASAHIRETSTRLLRVGIQAADRAEREAANLVFLVDVSGSMSAANKLPLVQLVLHETLDELEQGDRISIVTYAGSTRVALEPTGIKNRERIEGVIDSLQTGGGTDGASGIQLAYEQARDARLPGGINHVLLCTDGDFNLGISDDDALVKLIEKERRDGVTLTALGFGERNNDSMMERVTNAGNGVYSVLYSEDQAIEYTHERLMSSMVHIAKDMKIQVELNPDLVYAYRLLGYENRRVADTDFRDDSVDGGEVGAGHQVTALYELVLTKADLPEGMQLVKGDADAEQLDSEVLQDELVRVKVRYEAPGSGEKAEAKEVFASLAPEAITGNLDEADADTRWAVAVATFAERLRGALTDDDVSLEALRGVLAPLTKDGADVKRAEFLQLFDAARDKLEK